MRGTRVFPEGFLWGAATAAYQVEGGHPNSDWWVWEYQPHRIVGGHTSGDGAGWWSGHAEADLERAAGLGHTLHRMSVEWGRLEPEAGVWDEAAFDHYAKLFDRAHELGLKISLTLHHFTLPLWAARRGGWTSHSLINCFENLATKCADRFGRRVDSWATINEPSILAEGAYLQDRWPPGDKRLTAYQSALTNLLRAHVSGKRGIRAVLPDADVGLVLALPAYEPNSRSMRDRLAAQGHDWIANGALLESLKRGWVLPPIATRPTRIPGLKRSFDWLGLNYYGRYKVAFSPLEVGRAFGRHVQTDGMKTATSDWGEPYADGLTEQLVRLSAFDVPLMVTENGAFEDRPGRQVEYLEAHVAAVHEAINRGADVRGYCWWTLVDNFEWAEGWGTGFGLFELNRDTQVRIARPVADAYQTICRANAV